jgi:co-chaperonin GroES (HSP10)
LDFIPDTAKENHKKGTVVVVETEQKNTQWLWKLVICSLRKICGTVWKLEGKDYLIMREDDILANNIALSYRQYALSKWETSKIWGL